MSAAHKHRLMRTTSLTNGRLVEAPKPTVVEKINNTLENGRTWADGTKDDIMRDISEMMEAIAWERVRQALK